MAFQALKFWVIKKSFLTHYLNTVCNTGGTGRGKANWKISGKLIVCLERGLTLNYSLSQDLWSLESHIRNV